MAEIFRRVNVEVLVTLEVGGDKPLDQLKLEALSMVTKAVKKALKKGKKIQSNKNDLITFLRMQDGKDDWLPGAAWLNARTPQPPEGLTLVEITNDMNKENSNAS